MQLNYTNTARLVQLLTKARDLIAKPENWTTLALARNSSGIRVQPDSSKATCWCAVGALKRITQMEFSNDRMLYADAVNTLFAAMPPEDYKGLICSFNDKLGHAAVLDMYDKAIKKALPS